MDVLIQQLQIMTLLHVLTMVLVTVLEHMLDLITSSRSIFKSAILSIYNSSGTLVHSGGGGSFQTQMICLPDDCYSVVVDDSNCNGWWFTGLIAYTINPYQTLWTSYGPSGCSDTLTFALGSSSCTSLGCTDPLACNYDSLANTDDGSCTYPGCTDPIATNYDPTASCDDGSVTVLEHILHLIMIHREHIQVNNPFLFIILQVH